MDVLPSRLYNEKRRALIRDVGESFSSRQALSRQRAFTSPHSPITPKTVSPDRVEPRRRLSLAQHVVQPVEDMAIHEGVAGGADKGKAAGGVPGVRDEGDKEEGQPATWGGGGRSETRAKAMRLSKDAFVMHQRKAPDSSTRAFSAANSGRILFSAPPTDSLI